MAQIDNGENGGLAGKSQADIHNAPDVNSHRLHNTKNNHKVRRIIRLKFSDYIALIALSIAVLGAIYNLIGWLKGPVVSFRSPELVSFHCFPATEQGDNLICGSDSNVMIAGTNMTYVNAGRAEYSAVLIDETATLEIPSRKSALLHWHEFSNVTTLGAQGTLAYATVIPGASSIAHETRFFAREEPCVSPCDPGEDFVPWSVFVAALADPKQAIKVKFSAKVSAGGEIEQSSECAVFISDAVRSEFKTKGSLKTRITSLTCNY